MKFLLTLYELGPKTQARLLRDRIKGEAAARKVRDQIAALKKPIFAPLNKFK